MSLKDSFKDVNPISMGGKVLGGIMSGAMALKQLVEGKRQEKEGKQMLKGYVRPTYSRPQEIRDIDTMTAMRMFNPEIAGMSLMEDRISGNTANTINAAKEFGSSGDIYKAQIAENAAMGDLGIQSAQQQMQTEANRQAYLTQAADYTDKEFDYNVNIPAQELQQRAFAKINAGEMNQNTGRNALGALGAQMAGMSAPDGNSGGNQGGSEPDRGIGMMTATGGDTQTLSELKPPSARLNAYNFGQKIAESNFGDFSSKYFKGGMLGKALFN